MDPASESLLIGNALQKSSELPLFLVRDSGQQGLRVFARNTTNPLKRSAAFVRDMQSMAAAVVGTLAALD
jgi:hypothetical protein